MAFAAHLLENAISVLPWGGAFAAFPNKSDKCPVRGGGGGVQVELTEPGS